MAHQHVYRRTAAGDDLYYGWFEAMHSRADVVLCGLGEEQAGEAVEEIATEALRIECRLNRFDPASDLARLNGSPAGKYALDAEMAFIFADAARLRKLTLGMFDIAIQTPGFSDNSNPSNETEYYTLVDGGIELLRLGAIFDLGGYAKGYALERAREILRRWRVENALASFGNSSVLGLGSRPGTNNGWPIGIQNPLGEAATVEATGAETESAGAENGTASACAARREARSPQPAETVSLGTITLRGNALSISGNNLHNEGHIRSPLTGTPATGRRMVSVVAPSGSDAEALSTALVAAPDDLRPQIEANFPQAQAFYFLW